MENNKTQNTTSSDLRRKIILITLPILVVIIIFISIKLFVIDKDIYASQMDLIADQIQLALVLFPKPIVITLMMTKKTGQTEKLDLLNIISLNTLYIPVLAQNRHIDSINIATSDGLEYMLRKDNNSWITRTSNPKQKNNFIFKRWKDNKTIIKKWSEKLIYTPLETLWYKGAIDTIGNNSIYWSKPYKLFSDKKDGISASLKWKFENKGLQYVMAINILLSDMKQMKKKLPITKNTHFFSLNSNGNVYDLSFFAKFSENTDLLNNNKNIIYDNNIIEKAITHWKKIKQENNNLDKGAKEETNSIVAEFTNEYKNKNEEEEASFSFQDNNLTWWADFKPFYIGDLKYHACVIIPENELIPEAAKQQQLIMAIMAGVTAVGILLTILFFRHSNIVKEKNRFTRKNLYSSEEKLLSLIDNGEDGESEFKSTMRWNLKSNKLGKEIELAWLKTVVAFLNSNGGILLIGVEDDGKIVGMEADNFQNDDKCLLHFNNLVKQHIGLEFSRFIHFEIKRVFGQQIFIVECIKSTDPVFLKNSKDESFYVRSGPSSIKLSISEALKYINKS